ncbi:putative ATP-dependent helicase DinG [Sporosarcina sp. NCCP-2716]|uniref:ATP-dependent DNA helicase DinG n=1 Tax=Sporosarcina sp. NCCP-2716 TaxID=2943679 RepID=UPI002040D946|nr:ATP-dependent DNA helicase DinG [Sporosarcina sp. NCCP-2716]GKV67973.1 putative ATP-dependent helicase DinG [Sporosarcina sp. NCCP-2716]
MEKLKFAVVDLETTGHSPEKGDRIIQIAIMFIENGELVKEYVRFVNPGQPIPVFIQELTGISEQDVASAPEFGEIALEVSEMLTGWVFTAHNTQFDLPFLQKEFARCAVPLWQGRQIDTVELAKIVFPSAVSYRLKELTEELSIPLPSAHRADDDAKAAAYLLLRCIEKVEQLPERTISLLHKRSFTLKSDISVLFHLALNGRRSRTADDHLPRFRGIPYRRAGLLVRPENRHPAFPDSREAKDSLLRSTYASYETRASQLEFMDTAWDSLQRGTEVMVEVPTGMGKTISYLLPAAVHAIQQSRPVIVSTYTNHLADKIIGEEASAVASALSMPVHAVVLKGRSHYISLGKFAELLLSGESSYDNVFTEMQLLVWLTETATGDLNELNLSGGGMLYIDRVRKRSSKLQEDEMDADYHRLALQNCRNADLVITNHSLLLSDGDTRDRMIEDASGLIVDEAHQLIHAAYKTNEVIFSFTNWKYVMGQISSEAEDQISSRLESLLVRKKMYRSRKKEALVRAFDSFLKAFDDSVRELVGPESIRRGHVKGSRLHIELDQIPADRDILTEADAALGRLIGCMEEYAGALVLETDSLSPKEHAVLAEWQYWTDELRMKRGEWVELFLEEGEDGTVWMEQDERSIPGSLQVIKSPYDSARVIRKALSPFFEAGQGVVWTSGTMTVKSDERFVARQLGAQADVPVKKLLAPAHFYKGAQLFIVEDMPDIQQVSQAEYVEEVAEAVVQTVMVTGGRLFVLFTSQDMLKHTYDLIYDSGLLEEYALIAQGISSGSRYRLLKSFRQYGKAVLFGTNSFWEGVDVPGNDLSAIIIVRLPFSSPSEPIFKAKTAQLNKHGQNAFSGYALPEAILRLRQGFGRLIRSSEDTGFFIILDRRIETKSYGKKFLEALPDVPVKKVSLARMVDELDNCYNK